MPKKIYLEKIISGATNNLDQITGRIEESVNSQVEKLDSVAKLMEKLFFMAGSETSTLIYDHTNWVVVSAPICNFQPGLVVPLTGFSNLSNIMAKISHVDGASGSAPNIYYDFNGTIYTHATKAQIQNHPLIFSYDFTDIKQLVISFLTDYTTSAKFNLWLDDQRLFNETDVPNEEDTETQGTYRIDTSELSGEHVIKFYAYTGSTSNNYKTAIIFSTVNNDDEFSYIFGPAAGLDSDSRIEKDQSYSRDDYDTYGLVFLDLREEDIVDFTTVKTRAFLHSPENIKCYLYEDIEHDFIKKHEIKPDQDILQDIHGKLICLLFVFPAGDEYFNDYIEQIAITFETGYNPDYGGPE